jgi:hypothetical protein
LMTRICKLSDCLANRFSRDRGCQFQQCHD